MASDESRPERNVFFSSEDVLWRVWEVPSCLERIAEPENKNLRWTQTGSPGMPGAMTITPPVTANSDTSTGYTLVELTWLGSDWLLRSLCIVWRCCVVGMRCGSKSDYSCLGRRRWFTSLHSCVRIGALSW
jgi:hypothetical protein